MPPYSITAAGSDNFFQPPFHSCLTVTPSIVPPIANDFTFVGVIEQQGNDLSLFTLQLFGCALANNLTGPLNLQGSLIPPDLITAGLTFTTADISALEDEYMAAINVGLADLGIPPITPAQATAVLGLSLVDGILVIRHHAS